MMKSRDFGQGDNYAAKTPKVVPNAQNLFETKRNTRLINYNANSMSINLPEPI